MTLAEKHTKLLLTVSINSIKRRKDAKAYVQQLHDAISYHDHRYYVLNDPVISDSEYDQLFTLLKDIEKKWPDLATPTSPTQRIGEKLTGEFPEALHLTPMLSLDNSYNKSDLADFDNRVKKQLKGKSVTYTVEPKLDGTGISLIYEGDCFVRGTTRGDGIKGEDITNNLRTLRSIPLKAAFSGFNLYKVEIRGEVIIKKESFKQLNRQRKKQGLPLFANPRNAAGESIWRCINVNCPAQVKRRIQHFASGNAMNIEGMGLQTVDRFFEAHIIHSIPDIYEMDLDKISALPGFGRQSANNLGKAIETSKKRPLSRLINGLGINYIGERNACILADNVSCVTDIANMKKEELAAIPNIGEKVAQSIHTFFRQKENMQMIKRLKKAGVNIFNSGKKKSSTGKLSGIIFAFTGQLKKYSRDEARDIVEHLGGRTVGNISSKVNYVVAGKDPGSKLEQARKKVNLKIIDEKKFLQLIA